MRPWVDARNRAAQRGESYHKWNESTALAAYDAAGKKDPKWDAAAREGIKLFTDPAKTGQAETRAALEKAIQAGCDDPFVLYLEATFVARSGSPKSKELEQLYVRAAEGMEQSQYPAFRKCFAYVRCAAYLRDEFDDELRAGRDAPVDRVEQLNHFTIAAQQAWPQVLKAPGVPLDPPLIELANQLLRMAPPGGTVPGLPDRKMLYDLFFKHFENAFPNNSSVLALEGRVYAEYAWDARGVGYANTVTAEQSKLFQERLVTAEQVLTRAWQLNPNDAGAATKMLTVELGQGKGRDVMETWFKRAMKANPDDIAACRAKMYYLEPKWYGSPQEMIAFGRELRDEQNWYAQLPFLLVEAHETLSIYLKNPEEYFGQPEVWNDLQSIYKPWLEVGPDNPYARSRYAYYACRCGKWSVAKQQFEILGDKALPQQFGGADKMDRFRRKAMGGGL